MVVLTHFLSHTSDHCNSAIHPSALSLRLCLAVSTRRLWLKNLWFLNIGYTSHHCDRGTHPSYQLCLRQLLGFAASKGTSATTATVHTPICAESMVVRSSFTKCTSATTATTKHAHLSQLCLRWIFFLWVFVCLFVYFFLLLSSL